jgi:hypothetical protein
MPYDSFTHVFLPRVLREYVKYYNDVRPHQGIKQQVPVVPVQSVQEGGKITSFPAYFKFIKELLELRIALVANTAMV